MPATLIAPEAPALVLEPSDQAPSKARRYLSKRFRECGIFDDYVGRLVVTELVTNAYKHVGTGHIVVQIVPDERDNLIIIEVWDEGTAPPVVRAEDNDSLSGRGLLLMVQLVHDWGVRPLNEEGKVVWARCTR